ncbi:MAG: hypothetical protein Q9159_000770 [Coniocarpon cinnabarinum]
MNDVRKFFNRRSLGQDGTGSARFRRRSKSRHSPVSQPQDDPLTSAYSEQRPGTGNGAPDNGSPNLHKSMPGSRSHVVAAGTEQFHDAVPRGETLPGQAITVDANDSSSEYEQSSNPYTPSSVSLPEAAGPSRILRKHKSLYTHPSQGRNSSSRFEEDVANRNVGHRDVPPVPKIPAAALSGGPNSGYYAIPQKSEGHSDTDLKDSTTNAQHAKAGNELERTPIADQVGAQTPEAKVLRTKRKTKFSSASYYTRQNSPPPSFSNHGSLV